MSAITNKDRINENNDKINRLIELAKQKGLTSNPKQATTEDEMDAMITDKNVGKVVKYVGESGGKYEKDTLYIIAEGDETDSGLFARRLNITEGSLSITENGTYDVMDKASVDVNVTGSGGSDSNKLALVVGEQSADNPYDITASDLEGVTEMKRYAFYGANGLRSIELPTTCTLIANRAFYACSSLTSVTFGANSQLTTIGIYAFYNCYSLKNIVIPDSVTTIGDYAFYSCYSLISIIIPSAVASIGGYAFFSCTTLRNITMKSKTPPTIQLNTFSLDYINKIIVPAGCGEAYKTAENWTTFADYIEEATE